MKNVPFYFDKQMLMKKLNLYSVKIDKVFTKFWLFICLKIILIGWVLHCYRDVKMLKYAIIEADVLKKGQNYEEKSENFNIHCSNAFYDMRG